MCAMKQQSFHKAKPKQTGFSDLRVEENTVQNAEASSVKERVINKSAFAKNKTKQKSLL